MVHDSTDRTLDELLLTLIRAGDRRAAERLAARWYPRLLRTARRILGDDVEAREAVQDCWASVCRNWLTLSDPALFRSWAFSILHRRCADRLRKTVRHRAHFVDPEEAAEPASQSGAETRVALNAAFAALSPEHRVTAVLFYGEGLTLAEIAAATEVPLGTAKSRLFHARRQLRAHLEGDLT